jgi:hypothetical protein
MLPLALAALLFELRAESTRNVRVPPVCSDHDVAAVAQE